MLVRIEVESLYTTCLLDNQKEKILVVKYINILVFAFI